MMWLPGSTLLVFFVLGCIKWALGDVVYVTDLTIFTELAPCAAYALSYGVMSMTYSACPEGVTELQSCVCSKNNNFASVQTQVASSVSYSCGATATADQSSASMVYNLYCNQDSAVSFEHPATAVSQYVTDVNAWADLAPCARNALSYAVMSMTYDYCPEEASLLATCVCNKNQNSLRVSQVINTSVRYSCASHTADVSSAQAVFAAYCGLNNGTSSFPTTSNPPGDMTYYITGMAEYSSLAPCAQSAVSYGVFSQTYGNCPNGPQALASCACLKSQMPSLVSSAIVSSVRYNCDNTASEDVTSAISVWDYYCSAAKALVTPAGVTESVDQTSAAETAKTGNNAGTTGPKATSGSSSGGSSNSGAGASSGSNGSSASGGSDTSSTSKAGSTNIGAIVGGIVCGIVAILIGVGAFFLIRRRKARDTKHDLRVEVKPELDNNATPGNAVVSSTSSGMMVNSPSRIDNVSPISNDAFRPHLELQGQDAFPPSALGTAELQGAQGYQAPPQDHQRYPVFGPQFDASSVTAEAYGMPIHEASSRPVYEAEGGTKQPQVAMSQGPGWQSGPVQSYHEMDGGWHDHGRGQGL